MCKLIRILELSLFRIHSFAILPMVILLSSCFTGIEGTKKITLTKEEQKSLRPSEEDSYLNDIQATPNSGWEVGKRFYVVDGKAGILIDARNGSQMRNGLSKGDTLYYMESHYPISPDGRERCAVIFRRGKDIFEFSSHSVSSPGAEIMSDAIPGLIDLDVVNSVKRKIGNLTVWTKSRLREDDKGNRFEGKKYEKVTITDVGPGTMMVPLLVTFKNEDGVTGSYLLNYGSQKNGTHGFGDLFYLTDQRHNFSSISDDIWANICNGKVVPGMTKDEVKLSKGNPSEVNTGHDYSKSMTLWSYPDGSVLYFEDGILTGINLF